LLPINTIINAECLEAMKEIDAKSIDMILCDLPYQMTGCKDWDTIIPFDQLWQHYKRIIRDDGVIALTASQPFTSKLVMSNLDWFRYEWIWRKNQNSNFQNAKRQPLKVHESVLIFSKKAPRYYPQGLIECNITKSNSRTSRRLQHISGLKGSTYVQENTNYPKSIQSFNCERGLHATQKPVALFEYLIKTYTNEGEVVLDNCAGSFTTAVAADNTNRNWICVEKEKEFADVGFERVNENRNKLNLPIVKMRRMEESPGVEDSVTKSQM
jgi:site-specific DNA-methyltransferase (adenine-specific)